jgi:hypothetical protein
MHGCIVGTGRCGSTLLWDMLNRHPDLFVFRESHWIPKMYEFFGQGPGPVEILSRIVLHTTHVNGERVFPGDAATLSEACAGVESIGVAAFCDRVGRLLAKRAGKRAWADKTPDYGPYMGMLHALWPACRFLHVVRDGADVAVSMSRHPGYQWLAASGETWWVPASFNHYYRAAELHDPPFREYAELWARRLRRIQDEAGRLPAGLMMDVRFEDLVNRPAETLGEVCRFLRLESPAAWLAEASARADRNRVQSRSTDDLIREMGDGPRRLRAELGYAAGPAA